MKVRINSERDLILPADRLKAARRNAGYRTAKAFAEKKEIKIPTYAAHESGRNPISKKVAKKYAEFLNVSIEWLLSGNIRQIQKLENKEYGVCDESNDVKENFVIFTELYNYVADLLNKKNIESEITKIVIDLISDLEAQKMDQNGIKLDRKTLGYVNHKLKKLGLLYIK